MTPTHQIYYASEQYIEHEEYGEVNHSSRGPYGAVYRAGISKAKG